MKIRNLPVPQQPVYLQPHGVVLTVDCVELLHGGVQPVLQLTDQGLTGQHVRVGLGLQKITDRGTVPPHYSQTTATRVNQSQQWRPPKKLDEVPE